MWKELIMVAGFFLTLLSIFAFQGRRIDNKVSSDMCKEIHTGIRDQLYKVDGNFQEIYSKLDEQLKLLVTLNTKIEFLKK